MKLKSRWRKGEMARTIVIYCVKILTGVLLWAISVKTIAFFVYPDKILDLSDILTYAVAAFGGELLLLAFKRVFAKKDKETEDNNEIH